MYPEILPRLGCPACQTAVIVHTSHTAPDGDILTGSLVCASCQRQYPIQAGIANFLGAPRPATLAQRTNELRLTAWAYERIWRPRALTLLSGTALPYSAELALITDWAVPAPGELIVDLACSNGLYARTLAKALPHNRHILGIDHAMPMLAEARIRTQAAGLRVSYARASAQQLPLMSRTARTIVIGGSLNEIGDLMACLCEVQRTLMIGGQFVAMSLTSHPRPFERAIQRALASSGIQFWPAAELTRQISEAGMSIEDQRQIGIVLFTRSLLR